MKKAFLSFLLALPIVLPLQSQDFYDINTISVIELTFAESNWDALLDTYYANDNGQKLLGKAVVNGVEYDNIGVKYKGNSTYSASNRKNPMHIYLDYMINQDYDGYESIKLSNGKNDPSFVREVLSYEIARKYMKAPLSNYAKVYVNGSYYGMFSSSEAINGDFTDRRLFADNDNTRIKCNPTNTSNGGSSLEYLGSDSSSYYSYYEMKSDAGWQDLIDLTYSIENTPSEIENILDIDHAIWMLAFDNVLVNLDSYIGPFRQNYYLIKDDNGRFIPVIWDLNESFGAFEQISTGGGGGGGGHPGAGGPGSSTSTSLDELDLFLRQDDTTYPLVKMIFDNDRYMKMYVAHCKTMLEENFVNGWYSAKADTLQEIISVDLENDPNALYSNYQFTSNLTSTQSNTIGLTELMESRITYLQSLRAFQYAAPTVSNIIAPEAPAPFSAVTITADIANANYAYLAYRYSKDEAFTKLELYDDGAHNDGSANDGTYGVNFEIDESNTHYYIYAENSGAAIFSPQRAEHEYYKISAEATKDLSSDIVINEFMATNSKIVVDEYNEYDDWVELYNNTDEDLSLNGYYLSDDKNDIMQWAFPDTIIKANDYLIVWTDKDEEQAPLHTNFKISSSGESLFLVNAELNIVNSITFGEQTEDVSYARNPNGVGDFGLQGATFSYNNEETEFIASVDETSALDVTVYPNPVSNILHLDLNSDETTSISVYNMMGQSLNLAIIINQNQITLDMSNLPSGMYMIIIESANQKQSHKVIKE